jgi:putative hemolysin
MAVELIIILLLILLNGLLAMSEIAVISARKALLQQRADEGDSGARVALELARSPGSFLSTVQIGITLVGILAGAFGGATIAKSLTAFLAGIPILAPYANLISVTLIVLTITFLTVVLGELAPKRIALNNSERLASRVAPPMQRLAAVSAPLVRLLNRSSELVLRLLRVQPGTLSPVTDEEIRIMIRQGREVGVFEPIEEEIVGQLFRLSDRTAVALITPRTEIAWIDINDDEAEIRRHIQRSAHSRFPVADGDLDNVQGVVRVRDLFANQSAGNALELRAVMQEPLFVPESIPALDLLDKFRHEPTKIALVIDEYGGLTGLVSMMDVVEAIVGALPDRQEPSEPEALQRDDGSWLVDGMLPLDEFEEMMAEVGAMPDPDGAYRTVGGFVMGAVGRVPKEGDRFRWGDFKIEVVDMDDRRVDKVLVIPSADIDPTGINSAAP